MIAAYVIPGSIGSQLASGIIDGLFPSQLYYFIALLVLAGMFYVLLLWLSRPTPEEIAEAAKARAAALAEAAKARAEAIETIRNNPALNTCDWYLHRERLQKFHNSKYQGLHYFYGPRGGFYYINSNGHKTYC